MARAQGQLASSRHGHRCAQPAEPFSPSQHQRRGIAGAGVAQCIVLRKHDQSIFVALPYMA